MRKLLLILLIVPVLLFAQNPYDVKPKANIQKVEASKKDGFMDNFPYYKMIDWKLGMRFMTADDIHNKIVWMFGLYPTDRKNISKDLRWKTFVYEGLQQRDVSCPKGVCQRTYLIFDCEGDKYEHEYIGDTIEMRSDTVFNYIRQLIYLDDVDKAKELLLNKTLYIKTNQWLSTDEQGIERYSFGNQKFILVKIINIGLGTQDAPVKMVFSPLNSTKEYCLNVRFSGINEDVGIFGIDFNAAFQFNDPKSNYPKISLANWNLIQNGKVKIGMNKKECELSWGLPEKVNKTILGGIVSEQWVYSTDSYLYFKNGILSSIQN